LPSSLKAVASEPINGKTDRYRHHTKTSHTNAINADFRLKSVAQTNVYLISHYKTLAIYPGKAEEARIISYRTRKPFPTASSIRPTA
jgi:hypothetical protein